MFLISSMRRNTNILFTPETLLFKDLFINDYLFMSNEDLFSIYFLMFLVSYLDTSHILQ